MGSFQCTYCSTKRPNKKFLDEHIDSVHGGPKKIQGAEPIPEQGEPTNILEGLTEQVKMAVANKYEVPIEEAANMVESGDIERPRLNVTEQHMSLGGKALPSKVRVYDSKDHERYVPPEIAVDRVAFKGWTYPKKGEPAGHRKTDKWYTCDPCSVCGRAIESDSSMGRDEVLLLHQRKRHPTWWASHESDVQRKALTMMAEAMQKMGEK